MSEMISTVTSKGQITIPAAVREYLGIKQGDKLSFIIEGEEGEVRVKRVRYRNVESLRGIAGSLPKPLSWEEMLEIAHEDRAQEIVDGE